MAPPLQQEIEDSGGTSPPEAPSGESLLRNDDKGGTAMKRQIFSLTMALALTMGTALLAQSGGGSGGGANSGTVGGGSGATGTMGTGTTGAGAAGSTGTTGAYGTTTGSTTTSTYGGSTDTTTGTTGTSGAGTGVSGRHRRLPRTGSDMPLLGLLGALSLAGALGLRKLH